MAQPKWINTAIDAPGISIWHYVEGTDPKRHLGRWDGHTWDRQERRARKTSGPETGEQMKKVKKIYRYVYQLVELCRSCGGLGFYTDSWGINVCSECNGKKGIYKRVPVLVGKEVTE